MSPAKELLLAAKALVEGDGLTLDREGFHARMKALKAALRRVETTNP